MTAPNPAIIQAVEHLGYRVTVGDVASQAGFDVKLAERELLALAADAGGHLQVAESGEIAYLFPRNFQAVLRNKFWRLRVQEGWEKVWRILFYLIRISFGILLLVSILIILIAIALLVASLNSSRDSDRSSSDSNGGIIFFPSFWSVSDFWWIFYPDSETYSRRSSHPRRRNESGMNFLEAVFSFLFGDGNPNANLEERRWTTIAAVIQNHQGAVVAEQIAPYLDNLGTGYSNEYEEYMLPVLTRFNGRPEVSPEGNLVYHFPELQTTAKIRNLKSVPAFLQEFPWRFSAADSGQILLATGLGIINFVGALVLGRLLADGTIAAEVGGFIGFVQSIYGVLLAYGTGFLVIPLMRYFVNGWRNQKIEQRNLQRRDRTLPLENPSPNLQQKMTYAQQFAAQNILSPDNLVYSTETDLLEQEVARTEQIDAEWQARLESREDQQH